MLHKAARRKATTKTVRETEAIAFLVSQTIGLDARHASAESATLGWMTNQSAARTLRYLKG